MFKKTS